MIAIDFLKYQHRLTYKVEKGKRYIYDLIRKNYLVQTPEEVVRQLVLVYLLEEKGYSKNRLSVERGLKVNSRSKRFDILVFDEQMGTFLLVECKAPNVPVTQATFRQIASYNLPLKVRYLMVTNGIGTYCCEMDYSNGSFLFLNEVPAFPGISSQ